MIITICCVRRKHAIDIARTLQTRTCCLALYQILRSESRADAPIPRKLNNGIVTYRLYFKLYENGDFEYAKLQI